MAVPEDRSISVRRAALAVSAALIGIALLASIWIIGILIFDGFVLELGSLFLPRPKTMTFLLVYGAVGGLAALVLGFGLAGLSLPNRAWDHFLRVIARTPVRRFVGFAMLAAFLFPLATRLLLLDSAAVTDDEGCYLFSARLLAHGRLFALSPPDKTFFDRQFMFNDGRWFGQYFLGWPALMAPFAALGMEGVANPLYAALTVPPLYRLGQQYGSSSVARVATLLYVASPQMVIASATLLSHTTCWMALTWTLWLATKVHRGRASDADHAQLAIGFALAVFIRPLTALGFGVCLVPVVTLALLRRGRAAWRPALAFMIPSLLLAGLFLEANASLTGSPFVTAYEAVLKYKQAQGFKFSAYPNEGRDSLSLLHFGSAMRTAGVSGAALFHLNSSLHGWPASLFLALAAWGTKRTRLLWAVVGSCFFIVSFGPGVGVDVFGPLYFLEISIVLILLSAAGFRHFQVLQRRPIPLIRNLIGPSKRCRLVEMLVLSSTFAGAAVYLPVRLSALRSLAERTNSLWQLPTRAGVHHAVVFVSEDPWGPCNVAPQTMMLFRPENSPDLSNDVLWVNLFDPEANARFMLGYPDRQPYVLVLGKTCVPRLVPLSSNPVKTSP